LAKSSAFFQWRDGILTRSTKSKVTFSNNVMIGDRHWMLPAGIYEHVVQEEPIIGLSLTVYRRTAI